MKNTSILLVSTAFLSFATSAYAQDVSSDAGEQVDGLTDIIVTAQKREQNLQNVPVAVTAVSGEALLTKGFTQFDDLTKVAPGLTISQGSNITGNSIILRGIGTFAFSTGVEPSVSVVIDDLAVLQQGQAFAGLSDVERVEVLRGPQGTLFGKGASAGVINIVTSRPTENLSGSATLSATTDEQYRIEASISGPLNDAIRFRLNGFYADNAGYIENLVDDRKFGKERSWGLRGRLDMDLSDTLNVSVIASHGDTRSNGTIRTLFNVPPGSLIAGIPASITAEGTTPGFGNDKARIDADSWSRSTTNTASVRGTLDLGAVNLLSITGYQDWHFDFFEDVDSTATAAFGISGGVVQGGPIKSRLFSQELRLVSASPGPLQYLVGLYYSDGRTTRDNFRGPRGPLLTGWLARNESKTYAAFTQVTYDITRTTHIDAGLRLNREEIGVVFTNTQPTTAGGACVVTCVGDTSDNQVTGKISLRQDLADHVMAYASYATGYKGKGYDISSGFTPAKAATPVNAEHSKAYEIGLKSRFLDNRVQLNISGFLTDYDQFQAQSATTDPDTGAIQFQLKNVGKLRTKGIELELATQLTPAFSFDMSAAYTNARVVEFPFANCYGNQTAAQGCFDVDGAGPGTARAQDLAGKRLANSPALKYTISANYDIALPNLPFDAFISADYRHQSRVNYDLFQNPAAVQGGYGIMNAAIGIKADDKKSYRVTLFVNNLFDKAYATTIAGAVSASVSNLMTQVLPRDYTRYFGIRLNGKF